MILNDTSILTSKYLMQVLTLHWKQDVTEIFAITLDFSVTEKMFDNLSFKFSDNSICNRETKLQSILALSLNW